VEGFLGLARIPVGDWRFKFVLNGMIWVVDPGAPHATDADRNTNNALQVRLMDEEEANALAERAAASALARSQVDAAEGSSSGDDDQEGADDSIDEEDLMD